MQQVGGGVVADAEHEDGEIAHENGAERLVVDDLPGEFGGHQRQAVGGGDAAIGDRAPRPATTQL